MADTRITILSTNVFKSETPAARKEQYQQKWTSAINLMEKNKRTIANNKTGP